MPRAKEYYPIGADGRRTIVITCPGCGHDHALNVGGKERPQWTFNENFDLPTFSPSLLVYAEHDGKRETLCHSFVTNGRIQFMTDSKHKSSGKTMDLPEIE